MEALKKFLQLLGIIKDIRIKELRDGAAACAVCSSTELQTWHDFTALIDLLVAAPEHPARLKLHEMIAINSGLLTERLAFFKKLSESRHDWTEILRFAELPILFNHLTFERLNAEFASAGSVDEQINIIDSSFQTADPTHVEMLFLLVEGSIERHPEPLTSRVKELVRREKAARHKLSELLSGEMNDELRWWLIRTINSSSGTAQAFLELIARNRKDDRLQCMLLPRLLKIGFEWAEKFGGQTLEETESMQSHMFANRLCRLIELTDTSAPKVTHN